MIEAMKQALELLTSAHVATDLVWKRHDCCESLRQAIAELESQDGVCQHCAGRGCVACDAREQEPVAWMGTDSEGNPNKFRLDPFGGSVPLYTHPQPKREWVGLTDEEIEEGIKQSWVTEQAFQSAVWWAEAKLKEKNGYAEEKNT